MLCFSTLLNQKLRKFSGKIRTVFGEIDPQHQILTIRQIIKGVHAKNLEAILLFVDFFKVFDSIHRGKMEQILLAYDLPKETVITMIMLYKNMKAMIHSLDADTNFFEVVAGFLFGDTSALYLFIICLDYVIRTSMNLIKENGFTLKKARRYPAENITDTYFADYIAFLANIPTQTKSLQHSLE